MALSKFVWKNGKMIKGENAKANIFCQGLHYGASVFEGIRFYDTAGGPAVFRLPEHLERFNCSQSKMHMDPRYTREELTEAVKELIRKSGLREGYIRPIAWYGEEKLGLHIGKNTDVAIGVFPWNKRLEAESIRAEISPFQRISPKCTHIEAKISGHYVNSILALRHALDSGYNEAILFDWMGMIAEGSAENIFIVVNNSVYTPKLGSILSGITRRTILNLARDFGYRVDDENMITLAAFFRSDEIFLCGTAMEVLPVAEIDCPANGTARKWISSSDKVTRHLAGIYSEAVHGKRSEYSHWLTYVDPVT